MTRVQRYADYGCLDETWYDNLVDQYQERLQKGTDASKPSSGMAEDDLYFATDTKILYRYTGSQWSEMVRGETSIRLAQLSEKSHGSLTDVGTSDHHVKTTTKAEITDFSHNLGGSEHSTDTLANLNLKISDATLDDSGDPRTPTSHASTHQNLGADEINVGGLSGELADPQPPKTHNLGGSEHGADTLANLNLKVSDATLDDSGDPRDPNAHASSHTAGGSDEITVNQSQITKYQAELTITAGDESVSAAHGLGSTPNHIKITPLDNLEGRSYWGVKGASNVEVHIYDADPFNDHVFDVEAW